jgi:hypothetical protein
MANTYTLISSSVLSSTTASVTFSSIPATYTDLVLQVSGRSTGNGETFGSLRLRFNSDTATNYSVKSIKATPTPGMAEEISISFFYGQYAINGENATANTFGNAEVYIPSYTANQNKPFSMSAAVEGNYSNQPYRTESASLWRNTAAISTILVYSDANFVSGSSFYLYGIKNS